jgi:hypothetical protein
VADVKNAHGACRGHDVIDDAIDVRLIAMEELPECAVFRYSGTAFRQALEGKDEIFESGIPVSRGWSDSRSNLFVDEIEI